MENINFTFPPNVKINGYHSEVMSKQNAEKEERVNPERAIYEIFSILHGYTLRDYGAPKKISKGCLEALDNCCENVIPAIYSGIEGLGKTLAIAMQNKDAGVDEDAVSDIGYLFQILGQMSQALYELQGRVNDKLKEL